MEEEKSKEERLELAKKKYEELKKKKKKQTKKKKTDVEADNEASIEREEVEPQEVESQGVEIEQVESSDSSSPLESAKNESEKIGSEQPVSPNNESNKIDVENRDVIDSNESPSTNENSVEALKDIIQQHEKTIKKLRDENTDLKLLQMDLTDKIHELEQKLALSSTHNVPNNPLPKKLTPAKPVYTKNEYASSFHDVTTNDFREKLMVWKNWQVDMTNWNSTYSTEKVIL